MIALLLALAVTTQNEPDLSADAKRDLARLERRLEADLERGSETMASASARMLQAIRLGKAGLENRVAHAPILAGVYEEYGGDHGRIEFRSDATIEWIGWGAVKVTGYGDGWATGVLPNGNEVEFRSTYGGGLVMLVGTQQTGRSVYLERSRR